MPNPRARPSATRSPPSTSPSRSRRRATSIRMCNAAFSECDGLEMTMEVKTIREGGNNGQQIRLTGPVDLRAAHAEARHDGELRPVGLVRRGWSRIPRCAPTPRSCCSRPTARPSARGFILRRCVPVKLKAPPLNAKDGTVAIEELQLAYESLSHQGAASAATGWRNAACPIRCVSKRPSCASSTPNFQNEIKPDTWVKVQFNPETLKVSFANQIKTPAGAGDQSGPAARQFVGAGHDEAERCSSGSTSPRRCPEGWPKADRRAQADAEGRLLHHAAGGGQASSCRLPCASSGDRSSSTGSWSRSRNRSSSSRRKGVPLRASMTLNLSQQRITKFAFRPTRAAPGRRRRLGHAAADAGAGGSHACRASPPAPGRGDDWQSIAAANGIENPRLLAPGQLIDLNVTPH